MRPLTSNCKEIIGLSKMKTHPIIRFRKPMLYPLSYEGITGFSSPRRSDENHGNSPESIIEIPHLLRAAVGH